MFTILLYMHIAAGTIGLFCGTWLMANKKGTRYHKAGGRIFFYCMATVFASSVYMSLVTSKIFLLCMGIFSFFLAASGYRALWYKKVTDYARGPRLTDYALATAGIAAGVYLWVLAWPILRTGDFFAIVPVVFGTLSVSLAIRNFRALHHPPAKPLVWVRNHGGRMGGAYIAMLTAFIVVNIEMEMQWVLWILPTVVVSPWIGLSIRKFLKQLPPQGGGGSLQ